MPLATTVLFWGAAGTGKTATAEALGFEFGKALKVASFLEIVAQRGNGGGGGGGAQSEQSALELAFELARVADAVLDIEGLSSSSICAGDASHESIIQQRARLWRSSLPHRTPIADIDFD